MIPRNFGLCLFASFQVNFFKICSFYQLDSKVIVIIVLINISIGLLNNTIAQITQQKGNVWLYSRTKVWLRFVIDPSMPPPFNLLSYLLRFKGTASGCQKRTDDIESCPIELGDLREQNHEAAWVSTSWPSRYSPWRRSYLWCLSRCHLSGTSSWWAGWPRGTSDTLRTAVPTRPPESIWTT